MKPPGVIELAARAVLLQMRTGPWPVLAPPQVWASLSRDGLVRSEPDGWRITSAGYAALDARGWGEMAAPATPAAAKALPR